MKDYLEDIVGDESDEELEYVFIRLLMISALEKFEGMPYTDELGVEVRETMTRVLTDYDRKRSSI